MTARALTGLTKETVNWILMIGSLSHRNILCNNICRHHMCTRVVRDIQSYRVIEKRSGQKDGNPPSTFNTSSCLKCREKGHRCVMKHSDLSRLSGGGGSEVTNGPGIHALNSAIAFHSLTPLFLSRARIYWFHTVNHRITAYTAWLSNMTAKVGNVEDGLKGEYGRWMIVEGQSRVVKWLPRSSPRSALTYS